MMCYAAQNIAALAVGVGASGSAKSDKSAKTARTASSME
jgi:hypothetical protein